MSKTIQKNLFSKRMVIIRIDNTIPQFFDDLKEVCKKYNWKYTEPKKHKGSWSNNMINIKRETYLRYKVTYDVPSLVSSSLKVGWGHTLQIKLPPEYPNNLGNVRLDMETKLYHPRDHSGWMCLHINGEMDRILMDFMFHLLWDGTKIFADYNHNEFDGHTAEEIHPMLMAKMVHKYGTNKPPKSKRRVVILD